MATNIHQNVSEVSSTPTTGQPWNFSGILQSYLIPRVVAADSALPPGARLLWGVIRQHSWRDGRCTLSDDGLARAVGVSSRQCRRYCRQLERASLLRTTQRPGKPPIRELLWDARFAGQVRKTPAMEVRPPGQISPPPRTQMSGVFKEGGSSQVVSRYKTATIEKAGASNAPSLPARKPAAEWTEQEYIQRGRAVGFPEHVIQRDLERLRERRAKPQAEPMVKASELAEEVEASIPR